ncbi:acetyltransferase [Candidatus Thioglobus sp.]|nr:acetyltransferase [Candidatus Thioglobus sp.]
MNTIVLIGGGGHCRSVIDVIEQQGKYKIAGIIDKPELFGQEILGYKVIGNDSELTYLAKQYGNAIVTLGHIDSPHPRIELFNLAIKAGFKIPIIISPRAYVSKHSKVGKGSVVMHDALINANTIVGENCIINSKALIEHDCTISSHCHISTQAIINGSVLIGERSFVGSNSTTKQGVSIAKDSFIKAGSVVK